MYPWIIQARGWAEKGHLMSDELDDPGTDGSFELGTSPSHLLHRAQQIAANQSAQALREAGITLRQFSVLAALSEAEGTSQSRLVEATGVDRSTLADMVFRMEKTGLIARTKSPEDARAKAVSLTEKGRAALNRAAPSVRQADAMLLANLPKNRRDPFVDILSRIAHADPMADTSPTSSGSGKKPKKQKKSKAESPETSKKPKDEGRPKKKKKKKKK
jgi:DNA-binding MarR family transcriptional regulator